MEDYIKTTLQRAKNLYQQSQTLGGGEESNMWRKNAQFALESALRLSLINLKVEPDGFIVNFSEGTPEGNEVFLNGRPLGVSVEGLYEMPIEKLQHLANGKDMLLGDDAEFKK